MEETQTVENITEKMKQNPQPLTFQKEPVSPSSQFSPQLRDPNTTPKTSLSTGTYLSTPGAPRRVNTQGIMKHVTSSPPSPSPLPRRGGQPVQDKERLSISGTQSPLPQQLVGKSASRKKLFHPDTGSPNPANLWLKRAPNVGLTTPGTQPRLRGQKNKVWTPPSPSPLPRNREGSAARSPVALEKSASQSQQKRVLGPTTASTYLPPLTAQLGGKGVFSTMNSVISSMQSSNFPQARTEAPNESLTVPCVKPFAKAQQHGPPRVVKLPATDAQLNAGRTGDRETLSIQSIPFSQIQQTRVPATSSGFKEIQPLPPRRQQQTEVHHSSLGLLNRQLSAPRQLLQTKGRQVTPFAMSPAFFPRQPGLWETPGMSSPSIAMLSSASLQGPQEGHQTTNQVAKCVQPPSTPHSSQRGSPHTTPPALGMSSSPLQKIQLRALPMELSPMGLPSSPCQQAGQRLSSITPVAPGAGLPPYPQALQIGAIPFLVSAPEPSLSSLQLRQGSDSIHPVAPNITLSIQPQAQQTEALKKRLLQSTASLSQQNWPPISQRQSSKFAPPGFALAYQKLVASLPPGQMPNSSLTSNLKLPPLGYSSSPPDKQRAEVRSDLSQSSHPRAQDPLSNQIQETFVSILPPNSYPSLPKAVQKRKQDTPSNPEFDLQAKKQKIADQSINVNPLPNESNVSQHITPSSSGTNSNATWLSAPNQRERDVIKDIESPTEIHGENQSIVIAISGCTSSGKTNLAHLLAAIFSGRGSLSGESANCKGRDEFCGPRVRLLQQENFMLSANECPMVSWIETYPYTRPKQDGTIVNSGQRIKTRAEKYWELAYYVNVGIDPRLIMINPRYRSNTVPLTANKRSPNRDSRASINWEQLRQHLAAVTQNLSPVEVDGLPASVTRCDSQRQSFEMVDSAFLDGLRNRVRVFVYDQTRLNLEIKFGGRLVVNGMLKDLVLLEGSMLYANCEGAVQLMDMYDSKLFLPTSMEVARNRQLKKITSSPENERAKPWKTEGYFDYVIWPEFEKEHSWIHQSRNPDDPEMRMSLNCLDKNIFVCPKVDENAKNTASWAVEMILRSIAAAEQRARIAFQESNSMTATGAMAIDIGIGIDAEAAGPETSEKLEEQASEVPQLAGVWTDLRRQRELKSHREKNLDTLNGQAARTSQSPRPQSSDGDDSWMDEFVVWD